MAHLADDSAAYVEADNRVYADWCRSHGVETLATSYPDWKGADDPGSMALLEL